jgi:hypothetical protein
VQQTDDVVQDNTHRPAGCLGIAMRQRDGDLLVRALDHLHLVVGVVHQRVMQAPE